MLKTKVSCWFCNEDSHVFVFNKNSWTCPKCEQYNGFTKVIKKKSEILKFIFLNVILYIKFIFY